MKKTILLTNLIAVSAVLGMQNNFTEENRSPSKNPMRPVNAENLSASVKNYETLTDRDWIAKIVRMRLNGEDFNAPQNSDGQTILMCATKYADCRAMQQVLNAKDDRKNMLININAQDNNGNTALSIAVKTGDREKILLLLTNGADVKSVNEIEWAKLLMHADIKIMQQILNIRDSEGNRQININAQDKNGDTALSIAVKTDDKKKILLLLTNGADVELAKKKVSNDEKKKLEGIYQEVQKNNEELLRAAVSKNCQRVESLLKSGKVNVNAQGTSEYTALIFAAQEGHDKVVELLLKHPNINVNAQNNKYRTTALMIAAQERHDKVVKLLLKHPNINVNTQNDLRPTALIFAAHNGYDKVVELLLKHPNINVNAQNTSGYTALIFAAQNGHDKVVELLLKHPNINVNAQNNARGTALTFAAKNGHDKVVELLLKHPKIDVNAQNDLTPTALTFAAQNGHNKIVELLLKKKEINVNAQDDRRITALILAAQNGHNKVVELLLKKKEINVNVRENEYGVTALILAAQKGHDEVVEQLLRCPKINVNAQDNEGYTALMFAAQNGHDKIVGQLLKKKEINVDERDNRGYTALRIAAQNGHDKIVGSLLKYPGIKIDAEDNRGFTAFVRSIQLGREEIVKQFLEKGVDVNKEHTGRFTALMYAVEGGYARIVNLLLNQPKINLGAKSDEGKDALAYAEEKGRRNVIKLIKSKMGIQDQQFDPFIKRIKTAPADEIREQFWTAISRGDINEMDSLLDEKGKVLVDVNTKNKDGNTALIIASSNGNLTAVKWLLENNADFSIKDKNGDNALIRAAKKGYLDVVEELLFRKANINSTGQHKETALMTAAENGQLRVVKLLLKKGAKVSVKNDYNKTALDIVNEKIKKLNNINNNYESIKNILEKQNKQSNLSFGEEIQNLLNKWEVITDDNFTKDLKDWKKNDPSVCDKIKQLVDDIKLDPFRGVGRVERLTGDLEGLYSRRINKQNRLVYEVDGEKVILKSCKGHYEKEKRNRTRTNSEK